MAHIVIDDIQKKFVRKIITDRDKVLYAVTISVCKSMSSDGYVTFVCDTDHISFENHKFVLDYEKDLERTFKITDASGRYTTAQILLSDVAISHIDSIEERRLEQEAKHLAELKKILYDTLYFSLHLKDDRGDKLIHSYKSEEELKKEVKRQVFKILDTDLNNDILHKGHGMYDLEIFCDDGALVLKRTTYKKNAFALKNGGSEYIKNEPVEQRYYVRNDKNTRITIWDWEDLFEDIQLKQIENDEILNEERTEEEWLEVQEIAKQNAKTGCYNIYNLSQKTRESMLEADDSNLFTEGILASVR